jgi:uncharacterized protein YutE (UPF0331/DUF86 family)
VENLVMASLDIAKIILASEKKEAPQTYRETLRALGEFYFDTSFAQTLSSFAEFRNIIAHEYLDIRWDRIKNFIKESEPIFPKFISKIKILVGAS